MRISRKKSKNAVTPQKRYRINQQIRSAEVRLIDETGNNVGVTDTKKAIEMALDKGLDLVEVSPMANPPVAKIVDYSKLRYQEEKERRKSRVNQKKVEIKGIRLSLRIGEGDKMVRIKQAVKFLQADDKVKIEMTLKGRERQHKDLAREIVNKFIQTVNESVETKTEQHISILGNKLSVIIAKK